MKSVNFELSNMYFIVQEGQEFNTFLLTLTIVHIFNKKNPTLKFTIMLQRYCLFCGDKKAEGDNNGNKSKCHTNGQ